MPTLHYTVIQARRWSSLRLKVFCSKKAAVATISGPLLSPDFCARWSRSIGFLTVKQKKARRKYLMWPQRSRQPMRKQLQIDFQSAFLRVQTKVGGRNEYRVWVFATSANPITVTAYVSVLRFNKWIILIFLKMRRWKILGRTFSERLNLTFCGSVRAKCRHARQ